MKNKRLPILVAVIIFAGGLSYYLPAVKLYWLCRVNGANEETGQEPENPGKEYSVIANNGEFNRNNFHIYHASTSVLKILAQDRNYVFDLKQEGVYMELPQGEVTEVDIGALGMGTHEFTCGEGCHGSIFVDRDLDDYCEEEEE